MSDDDVRDYIDHKTPSDRYPRCLDCDVPLTPQDGAYLCLRCWPPRPATEMADVASVCDSQPSEANL